MFVLSQAADLIYKPETVKTMQSIYGIEPELIAKQQQRFLHLVNLFNKQFPDHVEAAFFSTPGRTEIGGNHTDHQRGNVLCASVNLDILALAAPNNENIIRLNRKSFLKWMRSHSIISNGSCRTRAFRGINQRNRCGF
jgi:hypothetical protein